MRIGIITYHGARNYGAFLQSYSLSERLNQEDGIEAEVIDFRMQKEVDFYKLRFRKGMVKRPIRSIVEYKIKTKQNELFNKDRALLRKTKDSVISNSLEDFRKFVYGKYDVIIAGSDEIWKTNGFRGFPTPYWLIGDLGCRKFSYAASARNDFSKMSQDKLDILKKAVNEFEFIGVRDVLTYDEVKKYRDKQEDIHLCCDPTFLYEFKYNTENGKSLLDARTKRMTVKKRIGVMTENNELAKEIRKALVDDYELYSLYQWQPGYNNACDLSPFEWLDALASLDLVITSFFHAACFSLKAGTRLISFGTAIKSSKLIALAEQTEKPEIYVGDIRALIANGQFNKLVKNKLTEERVPFVPNEKMLQGYNALLARLKQS